MDLKRMRKAVEKANAFLECADEVEKRIKERAGLPQREGDIKRESSSLFFGSKESGALRRASMELTRSLSDLRKP